MMVKKTNLILLFLLVVFSTFAQNEIEGRWSFSDTSRFDSQSIYSQFVERYVECIFQNDSIIFYRIFFPEYTKPPKLAIIDSSIIQVYNPERGDTLFFGYKIEGEQLTLWKGENKSDKINLLKVHSHKGKLPKNITNELTFTEQVEAWKRLNAYLVESGKMTKRQIQKSMKSWRPLLLTSK